jgi:hypothetical protein
MPTKIKLVANYINDIILFTTSNNNVTIQKTLTDNSIPYRENITINTELENYIYKNEYYIYTNLKYFEFKVWQKFQIEPNCFNYNL